MSTADKALLGRAFARDPRWRWMPGMRDVAGLTCTVVDSEGRAVMWATASGIAVSEEEVIASDPAWPVPDLDDHATIGCIEHGLLPDLIGMPNASLWWSQGKWHYGCGATSWGQGRSKGEALLSALRSVGRGVALRG